MITTRGNTVILKGPEAAPATYWALASILHKAGLPAGALNTLYHRPADASQVTNALIAHPSIKKINFTGSTNVGSIIAGLAGKNLKPTVMELGGKAPSIVCEDANIQTAALQTTLGAFLHGGQICMSTERILVNAKIADEFRNRKIPCDVIWMDIDYMDNYKIFTFDPVKFPDPKGLNDYLHSKNIKSV